VKHTDFNAFTGHFLNMSGKITTVLQSTKALAAETQQLLHSKCEEAEREEIVSK